MNHCILCLKELPIFAGLETPEFTGICFNSVKKKISKGTFLFHQDEPANTIYLIKEGKIKLVKVTFEGREIIFDIVGPGDVLGETSLFKEQRWLYSGIAIEDTSICCFSRKQFELYICKNPKFAIKIISYLNQKLYDTIQKVGENTGIMVKEKLMRLFIRLAQEHGCKSSGFNVIKINITQQELADMIGSSRVMVALALRELKRTGIAGRCGKYYLLKDDACIEKNFRKIQNN